MRRFRKLVTLLAVSALASAFAAVPAVGSTTEPGLPVYLSLGDSWAYGQGADNPATEGFAAQLHEVLRIDLDCLPAESDNAADGCKHLNFINLGRMGDDVHPGVTAPIVTDEQLPIAIPMLTARNQDDNPRNNVEAVTLIVGGNDVSGPVIDACLNGGDCFGTLYFEVLFFEQDLRSVVSDLRAAAGPDTMIVLGTYDNPAPYCYLAEVPGAIPLGDLMLEGTPDGALNGIHDAIRQVAGEFDAEVAEVFGTLGEGDFVGGFDCLHPTSAGYDKITDAFADAINN